MTPENGTEIPRSGFVVRGWRERTQRFLAILCLAAVLVGGHWWVQREKDYADARLQRAVMVQLNQNALRDPLLAESIVRAEDQVENGGKADGITQTGQ